MAGDQTNDFDKRLSQWVASQGFWFQLRYSMAGRGMRGRAMFHLVRMFSRLALFLVVAVAASWFFLLKRTESAGFAKGIEQGIKEALVGSDLAMRGLNYSQGQLEIPRLAAEGQDGTFFRTLQVVSLRCKMKLVDGLIWTWDPGVISIARLDLDLRAGGDDAESAARIAKVLFDRPESVKIEAFEVGQANLHWGYSERTQGSIESSAMRAQRTPQGWRLSFKGGTFSQNWLAGLEIVNLVLACDPEGIRFEKAEFKQGKGTVHFTDLRVIGGSRPQVKGTLALQRVRLDHILPAAAADFIEGSISGEFVVSGSTNSSEGVCFDGQVVMDGEDVVTLRDRLPMLTALSVMDYSRNYHRIDFREGSFRVNTAGGGLSLTDVNLAAGDLFTLKGGVKVRLPTQQEIQEAVSEGGGRRGPMGALGATDSDLNQDFLRTGLDFSLKRAAIEAKRAREGLDDPAGYTLFDRLSLNSEMRQLEVAAAERLSRMLRYEGAFEVTIPGDAFERAGELQLVYPRDPTTGRVHLQVPIDGHLYQLTEKQAQQIYNEGRRL